MNGLKFISGHVVGLQRINPQGDQIAVQRNVYRLPDGREISRYQYEHDPRLLASRPTVNVPIGSFFEYFF